MAITVLLTIRLFVLFGDLTSDRDVILDALPFVKQWKIFFLDHFEMMNLMSDRGEAHRQNRYFVLPIEAGVEQRTIVKTLVKRFCPEPRFQAL